MDIDEHLFRREAGRIVATLTRIFGVHNLELAEDVVQDAFCRALEIWKFRGVPDNPAAWLMTTAKNRALDILRRERTARTFAPELGRLLEGERPLAPAVEQLFQAHTIKDDLLRMMFSCCHPRLPEEAHVCLILHILCGFSVDEIASAFVSSRDAIEKRIGRSKKVLAGSNKLFDLSSADFSHRLPSVHRALYLLFNEGYHGASPVSAVRVDLCLEAIRLQRALIEHPLAATPATHALAALMCFDAARLPSRLDVTGNLSALFDQDRSRWDAGLINEGQTLLELSANGPELTEYHVEAAIACIHSMASRIEETDWGRIVFLYDTLMTICPSPIVALNRAVAIGQHEGPERGIHEIRAITHPDRLASYPFYHAALGEFEFRIGRLGVASEHFRKAEAFARNAMERQFFAKRIRDCEGDASAVTLLLDDDNNGKVEHCLPS